MERILPQPRRFVFAGSPTLHLVVIVPSTRFAAMYYYYRIFDEDVKPRCLGKKRRDTDDDEYDDVDEYEYEYDQGNAEQVQGRTPVS